MQLLLLRRMLRLGMVQGLRGEGTKVPDMGSVFLWIASFIINFYVVSIASAHSNSYQTRPPGPRLMGSLRLCAQAHGEALQWVGTWVGLSFELRKCYLEMWL